MTAKRITFILMGVLVVYLVIALSQSIRLIQSGEVAAIVMGLGLLILPLIGAWILWRELAFGMQVERMAKVLEAEGALPVDDLPRTEVGGIDRDAADAAFETASRQAQADPQDWRSWFRVAASYDAARDRKRARGAMYHAISLFRAEQASAKTKTS
ncbi:MAG: hypothetical protein WC054_12500 [Candidatus Nanopelagicales bacterium]